MTVPTLLPLYVPSRSYMHPALSPQRLTLNVTSAKSTLLLQISVPYKGQNTRRTCMEAIVCLEPKLYAMGWWTVLPATLSRAIYPGTDEQCLDSGRVVW